MPDPYTRVNLVEVEVAAPDVARALEAGPDGLEFPVVGPHHQGDGEPVEDPWVA
jgi:hypothetical protein